MIIRAIILITVVFALFPIAGNAWIIEKKVVSKETGNELWTCDFPLVFSPSGEFDTHNYVYCYVTISPPQVSSSVGVEFEATVTQLSGAYLLTDATTRQYIRKELPPVINYRFTRLFIQPVGSVGDAARVEMPCVGLYAPENKSSYSKYDSICYNDPSTGEVSTSVDLKCFHCEGRFAFIMNRAQFEEVFINLAQEFVFEVEISGKTTYQVFAKKAEDRNKLLEFWKKRYVEPMKKFSEKKPR